MKNSELADSLPWTGERLVTSCQRPLAYEHLHRYSIACGLAEGKRVLDIACGEGYGSNLLADFAAEVVGVDKDPAAIGHAAQKYRRPNLRFVEGDCTALPLADHSVDLVASFETIEHISDQQRFMDEIKRVLAPDGVLVISSPDKAEYATVSQSVNPFHQAELTHDDFVQLVGRMFKHCLVGKQRLVVGSWIAPDGAASGVTASTFHGWFDRVDIEPGVNRGLYSIAIGSDAKLPNVKLGMFENHRDSNETWDLLDRYDSPANVALRIGELERLTETTGAELANLNRENEAKSRHLVELDRQIVQLDRRTQTKSARIGVWKRRHDALQRQATQLDQQLHSKAEQLLQLRRDSEARAAELSQLQTTHKKKTQELTIAQEENQRRGQQLERSETQLAKKEEELARQSTELLDARWEVLTLRAELLRGSEANEQALSQLAEVENQAQSATSERDQLRKAVLAMLQDLEQERLNVQAAQQHLASLQERANAAEEQLRAATDAQLRALQEKLIAAQQRADGSDDRAATLQEHLQLAENRVAATAAELQVTRQQWESTQGHLTATAKDLAAQRKQMLQLREHLSRKLILPFGKSQQKLEKLIREVSPHG